uniref:Reverse transcriptase domain-containing protein n=1 Tax=Timema douglasi TaxID=61478 RepID=A0A7R8VSV4_TIMDO|nr:unnamed protein product [Timema douglasi]
MQKKNQASEKKKEGESKLACPAARVAGNRKPSTGRQSSASQPTSAGNVRLNQPSYSGVVKKLSKKDKQENRSTEESSDLKDLLQILKEINVVGLLQLLRKYLVRLKNAPDNTTKLQPNSSAMATYLGRGVEESLNILFWNAYGIAQQEHEFRKLLGTYGVDVAMICETHLSEQKMMRFRGYEMYRNDRAAIPTGWKKILFLAVYRSPVVPFTIDDLDRLTSKKDFLLAGDLNCKHKSWNSRVNLPDFLDVILTDLDTLPEELEVLNELDSYHLQVFGRVALKTNPRLSYLWRKIPRSYWDEYRRVFTDAVPLNMEVNSPKEVDSYITLLTATLLEAYRGTTVFETPLVLLKRDDPELSYLIALKREARREWQQHRDPRHRAEYSRLRALVHRKAKALKITNWNEYVANTLAGDANVWKVTRQLKAKAEAIAESSEDQFKANSEPQYEEFTRTVNRAVGVYLADPVIELPPPITRNEVTHQVEKLKLRKAASKRPPLHNIRVGVPQGLALSPFLYIMYVADISRYPMIKTRLFADDTLFYIANRNVKYAHLRLQRYLDEFNSWLEIWRIKPILVYGCEAWGYASDSVLDTLQIVQNKVLRCILGVNTQTNNAHIHATTGSSNFVGTPFIVPTSHRDSCCRDYFLSPTVTHVLPGLPPYTPQLSPSAGNRHRCSTRWYTPTAPAKPTHGTGYGIHIHEHAVSFKTVYQGLENKLCCLSGALRAYCKTANYFSVVRAPYQV